MTEDIKSCEKGGTAPDFTYQIKKKKNTLKYSMPLNNCKISK